MVLMTGFFGLAVGAIAGWIASRRSAAQRVLRYPSVPLPDVAEEDVIDLRESQLTIELRTELRAAQARIEELERSEADLKTEVSRKDQAVIEARNTLRAVRDSLANTNAMGPITALEAEPVQNPPVVEPETASAQSDEPVESPRRDEAEQSFDDLHKRLRNVTGDLAEVTRRHRSDS